MRRFGTKILSFALVTLFTTALAQTADAGIILFTKTIRVHRSVNIFDTNQFDFELGFGDKFSNPTNGVTLFDGLVISPANVGQTFEATVANDPGFALASQRLVDGVNEYIKVMLTESQSNGLTEQRGWRENLFFNHVAPQTPPDLLGSHVDSVILHVDKFTLSSTPPAGGPAALAATAVTAEPQFDLIMTLQLVSNVPEPTAYCHWLVGLATLALGASRRAPRQVE